MLRELTTPDFGTVRGQRVDLGGKCIASTFASKGGASQHCRRVLAAKLGRPLAPDMYCLHVCDNGPWCCNEQHLYEGTQKENIADAILRGAMKGGRLDPEEIQQRQRERALARATTMALRDAERKVRLDLAPSKPQPSLIVVEQTAALKATEHLKTTQQLAYRYGVSASTIKAWKKRGMPCRQVGRVVRFDLSEVEPWVAGQSTLKQPGGPDRRRRGNHSPRITEMPTSKKSA